MTYSKDNLRQIFQQPFNEEGWQNMLRHYFHATELKAERERIDDTPDDEKGYYLGAIDTTDNYRIGLFYYQIQHGNVARKRVGLRNLVKSFINPNWGEFDAALVVFDSGFVWRLSFVCDIKGENTAAKRFTYVFGESDNYYNTPVGRFDALQRNGISFENIKDAFSVERLNKDFFNGYKERYVKFLNHINDDTKENRDYVKKLLGRLVFLQFLQKKGWMGVPANLQGWNGGDKFYLNHLIESYEGNDRLLSDVLEPLFFNTLNERRTNDLADPRLGDNIKIPYLNGGLFDKDELDKKDFDFPYDYFKELMDFFAMYNFTIDENDPEDSEIGIDPEMLGHIFENLLEDNKDKGAFYTPKEIVQYMSKESVAQYLKSNTPEDLHTAIDSLIKQRVVEPILQNKENARLVNKALSEVKVCDPAIGSGAFPMGVLNVLFDCRHLLYGFIGKNEDFSYAKVKRDIIQNNIYGVDIEKGAVDIARLRFWLALVVDENDPQPLPNLDYKIMCGDSLLHRFPLDAPFQNVLKDYNQKNGTNYTLDDYRQWVYDYTDISDHTQKDDFRQRIEDIKRAVKTELNDKEKGKIAKVRGTIKNLKMEDLFGGKKKENEKKIKALQKELKALEQQREEIESNKIYEQAFEWRFEFPALLDENGKFTGFDIIIGNPPYVNIANIRDEEKRKYYQKNFSTVKNKSDLYSIFTERAKGLLTNNGILGFIFPNSWMGTDSFSKFREFLAKKVSVFQLVKLPPGIFEDAVVTTILCFYKNTKPLINNFIEVYAYENNEFVKMDFVLYYNQILNSPNTSFAFERTISLDTIPTIPLGDIASFSLGIKTSDDARFVFQEKIDETCYPFIRGRNISRWSHPYSSEWLWYQPKMICEKPGGRPRVLKNFLVEKKIVIQDIATQITATIDSEKYLCNDTLNIIYSLRCDYSYEFILCLLNSKLINVWFKKIFPAGLHIKTNQLEQIPIPTSGISFQQPFIALANTMLSLNSQLQKERNRFLRSLCKNIIGMKLTSNLQSFEQLNFAGFIAELRKQKIRLSQKEQDDWENYFNEFRSICQQLLAQIDTTHCKIDLLVYHLYGLTYNEVLIVDPETPITQEEY